VRIRPDATAGQKDFIPWSPDRDAAVAGVSHPVRTVVVMASLTRFLRSLGNAGAVANAYRACEERKLVEARVDALASRLTPTAERRGRAASA
jgi:hypothetical protein